MTMNSRTEHTFIDDLTGQPTTLIIGHDRESTGVRHDGCVRLAEVFPDLDCASCIACQWQCRISGAWFLDMWEEARDPDGALRRLLAEVYRPEGVAIWLNAKHQQFGGLTVDEMRAAGRIAEVFTVAHQLVDGAFA